MRLSVVLEGRYTDYNSSLSSTSSGIAPKPKSKLKSRLKKAALVGVGVYAGYKLTKMASKFAGRRGFTNYDSHYDFDDWNDWREADGFLCRSDNDCEWIDDNLSCEDYELDFSPSVSLIIVYQINRDWTVKNSRLDLKPKPIKFALAFRHTVIRWCYEFF